MSDDPLVFIPIDRWSELKTLFKSDWPRCMLGLMVLETQEFLMKSGVDYGFKVYCPHGNVNDGMVAINITNNHHEIIIQCHKDDTSKLEEALKTTKIIDWSKCNQIPALSRHTMSCVERLFSDKDMTIDPEEHITKSDAFVLDKDTPPYDVRLPPGFSFDFLTLDSIPMVNEVWPYNYAGSEWYCELLVKSKMGYGLYDGKELLAWVFIKEVGALGHLYTLEKHRRKGYGELVVKLISNIRLKDNKHTVAYCAAYNTTAACMYEKLGFKKLIRFEWIYRH